jgi:hypothetical protein
MLSKNERSGIEKEMLIAVARQRRVSQGGSISSKSIDSCMHGIYVGGHNIVRGGLQ